jgi:hypothetical protein
VLCGPRALVQLERGAHLAALGGRPHAGDVGVQLRAVAVAREKAGAAADDAVVGAGDRDVLAGERQCAQQVR